MSTNNKVPTYAAEISKTKSMPRNLEIWAAQYIRGVTLRDQIQSSKNLGRTEI